LADPTRIQGYLSGFASTAPNAEQVLAALVAGAPGQIRTVTCYSQSGSGGTATIIDVRKNGVTAYTNPANRPTLAAGQTGKFTSFIPNSRNVRAGDILTLVCAQAGGHAGVIATVALEEP
jgi:hypothetical protein